MRALRAIALVGLLCAVPAVAFAGDWRDREPVRRVVVEPQPAGVVYVPRGEVRHHHFWAHRPHHATWVPGHWVWSGHHRYYQRGYWRRAW